MAGRINISILFLLIIGILEFANGFRNYNWVPLNEGDKLPKNTVFIKHSDGRYIGRARYFDEMLPAEITEDGSAFVSSCNKVIPRKTFEVLTTSATCEWIPYNQTEQIDETVLRIGSAWNGEPIFAGFTFKYYFLDTNHITSIYLSRKRPYPFMHVYFDDYGKEKWRFLSCGGIKNEWIETASAQIPDKAVSGGLSKDGYEMYVAVLKRGCSVVIGQVIPKLGIATAFLNNGTAIESRYCKVLVGEPNEYTWISSSHGEIPDYAVVYGKQENELVYVARVNRTIRHLTHSEALHEQDYDILVTNELNTELEVGKLQSDVKIYLLDNPKNFFKTL